MNVDPACILSLFLSFYFLLGCQSREKMGFSKMEFAIPWTRDGDVGVGSDRWDRKIHRRLKDKGKMANKTVGRAWNRQSITTWAHHVAGEIKSTEPLDMRGN